MIDLLEVSNFKGNHMKKKPYSKKRICIICEIEYDAPSPQSRVCSDECKKEVRKRAYTKHNRKRIEENRITHKDCVYCGKKFELKSNSQRYCSEKCKRDAGVLVDPLPKERKCKCCDKSFSPSVSNQVYCSKKCQYKVWDDLRIEKLKKSPHRVKKCQRCNKSFIITGGNNQYCSSKCQTEIENERSKKRYHENKVLKGGFSEDRKCKECNTYFVASNFQNVFCSDECRNKSQYRRKKERGEIKYDGEYMRKYHKERRDNDPKFNMMGRIRHRTREAIKRGGFTKRSKTYEMLGCDWDMLKEHIEKQFVDGMSWDNMSEWDLDHIYPLSWCETIDELEIYAHFTNLQPLWRKDNQDKKDKYIG